MQHTLEVFANMIDNYDVQRQVRRAGQLAREDKVREARDLLLTLAWLTRRYASVLRLADEPLRACTQSVAAMQFDMALKAIGGELPADTWIPVVQPVVLASVSGNEVASFTFAPGGVDAYVYAKAKYHHPGAGTRQTPPHPTEPIGVEVCIVAPDPARTQLAFDVIVKTRDEAIALVQRWAEIGVGLIACVDGEAREVRTEAALP